MLFVLFSGYVRRPCPHRGNFGIDPRCLSLQMQTGGRRANSFPQNAVFLRTVRPMTPIRVKITGSVFKFGEGVLRYEFLYLVLQHRVAYEGMRERLLQLGQGGQLVFFNVFLRALLVLSLDKHE